jgi:hypothetical protein
MNTKKLFTTLAAIGFASVGLIGAHTASAAVILNAGNADCSGVQPAPNDQPGVEADFKLKCATGDVSQLYKSDFGGSDSGPYADSYDTDFSPGVEPSNADIMYVLAPFISGYSKLFVLAKDGAADPTYYGWNISGWNGTDTLSITAWNGIQGAISNVSIWGTKGAEVPEPGPIGLLGAGLIALFWARRRIAAR